MKRTYAYLEVRLYVVRSTPLSVLWLATPAAAAVTVAWRGERRAGGTAVVRWFCLCVQVDYLAVYSRVVALAQYY